MAVGIVVLIVAVGWAWLLTRSSKKVEAPKVEVPTGPDPAIEARAAELLKQIQDLETGGRYEDALASLRQLAALQPDHPQLATLKSRLEEKQKQLALYLKAFQLAEAARSEASAKDTPANWQKVADACAEAQKLALLEEHQNAVKDLLSLAHQRRDWAAAREEEQKGNLDAAIDLVARAVAAREPAPELAAYKSALEKKRRKRDYDKAAAAARAEADPRRAIELWQKARVLADDPRDVSEAEGKIDALKPASDPAERDRRYEAAMKLGEESLAAGKLDEADKAFRDARALKGIDIKADQGLAKVEAARRQKAYEALMAEAGRLEVAKEWGKASDAYDRALRLKPGDTAASARRKEIEEVHRPPRISIVLDETVGLRMEFVLVKPGTFQMGDAQGDLDEKPCEVTITKDFWMQVTEVTQAQWRAVMGTKKSWTFGGLPTLPAEGVSWEEAQKFLEKLNAAAGAQLKGRKAALPTEAEWEYACRAGSRTRYPFGDGDAEMEEFAWFTRNSQKSTQGAGKKKPNAWGLHDMLGNVAEWCQDWYGPYKDKATDPSGPAEGQFRVFRGGGWNDRPVMARPGNREKGPPEKESMDLGMRTVLR